MTRPVNLVTIGFFIAWGLVVLVGGYVESEATYFWAGVGIIAVGLLALTPWGSWLR